MSLSKMARVAAAPAMTPRLVAPNARPVPDDADAGAPPPPAIPTLKETRSNVNTALSAVATFIPSEVLALYMALLGLVIGTSEARQYGTKWSLFALGILLCLFAVFDGYMTARKAHADDAEANPPPDTSRFVKIAVFAVVAFTIYAMAIPDTPFEQLAGRLNLNLNLVGGVLALLAAFVLPTVASWLGVPAADADTDSVTA